MLKKLEMKTTLNKEKEKLSKLAKEKKIYKLSFDKLNTKKYLFNKITF